MAEPRVVDAVSTPVGPKGPDGAVGQPGQGVPIKLDTSSLSKAIQSIVEANTPAAAEQRVNPAKYLHESSEKMMALYSVYEKLRTIGKHLNGKLVSDPIPEGLIIEDVTINFRTSEGDNVSEPTSVALKHITTIGDISNLLSTELGAIIVMLQQETEAVLDIAGKTKELCEKSRRSWEEANKDKRIQEETDEQVPTDGGPEYTGDGERAASAAKMETEQAQTVSAPAPSVSG